MNIKKAMVFIVGAAGTIATLAYAVSHKNSMPKVVASAVTEPEETFGGITLSELNDLAKNIYHGLRCTLDQWGFLVFHSKSNRGHQTFHTQMTLDDAGKLINLGGHYPGQWWSSADEFAKKANELFKFKK